MSIQCKCCQSTNVRSFDNQHLYHPTKQEVADGNIRFETEVYIEFVCDDCEKTFTEIFSLVLQK